MEPINSAKIAATLTELRKQIDERRRTMEQGFKGKKTVANRAVLAMNATTDQSPKLVHVL